MLLKKSTVTISKDDFLQGEKVSDIKHEFVNGQVFAMAGASVNHNKITTNVVSAFLVRLRGQGCRPYSNDMLVKTSADSYRYPDVMVVCDEDFVEDDYATQTPVIIVEVISKTTRQNDKQDKRLEYINMPSLQEYVLIEQDFVDVEVFRKNNGWQPSHYFLGDDVLFESVEVTVSVEEIYDSVRNEDVEKFLAEKAAT